MFGFGDYGIDTTGFDQMFRYNYPHYVPSGGAYATNNLVSSPARDTFLGPKKKEEPLWKSILTMGVPIAGLVMLGTLFKNKLGLSKLFSK